MRDSCGSSGTGETPQAFTPRRLTARPAESEHLEGKSTTTHPNKKTIGKLAFFKFEYSPESSKWPRCIQMKAANVTGHMRILGKNRPGIWQNFYLE